MSKDSQDIFTKLNQLDFLKDTSEELKIKLADKLHEMRSYTPKIGVFGKTGVGKSSLCNALFGEDICDISAIDACTRIEKTVPIKLGGGNLELIDVPGVGESGERDKEYDALYQEILPKLDLIFWVFKGDDRAAASDEQFYNRIIRRYVDAGKPFLAVINQVDKIEPFRQWDEANKKPGAGQQENIEKKRQSIAGLLRIEMAKVIPISANERYGLVELVDSIVHALPNDKKSIVLEKIKAAEEAEISAANAKAAEAQAKAEEMRARAEAERISLEKSLAENSDRESQRKHELEMAELKLRHEREQREADEKARSDREAAEERARNRNVSRRAEEEADNGLWETVKEVAKGVGSFLVSKISSLKFW